MKACVRSRTRGVHASLLVSLLLSDSELLPTLQVSSVRAHEKGGKVPRGWQQSGGDYPYHSERWKDTCIALICCQGVASLFLLLAKSKSEVTHTHVINYRHTETETSFCTHTLTHSDPNTRHSQLQSQTSRHLACACRATRARADLPSACSCEYIQPLYLTLFITVNSTFWFRQNTCMLPLRSQQKHLSHSAGSVEMGRTGWREAKLLWLQHECANVFTAWKK